MDGAMNDALGARPAFSRFLKLADVPPEGLDIDLAATPAERDALARLNGLPALQSLTAALRVRRWRGDGLEIDGELRANLRQNCVATLEAFDSEIVEPVHMRFAPPRDDAPRSRKRREPPPAAEISLEDDPPDPLIGDAVDLGAAIAEFFTLALDPYPRKPGAQFMEPPAGAAADVISPFAALRVLKTRGRSGEDG